MNVISPPNSTGTGSINRDRTYRFFDPDNECLQRGNRNRDGRTIVRQPVIDCDLEKHEFKEIVDIRNYPARRYVLLHHFSDVNLFTDTPDSSEDMIENSEYHMEINDFLMEQ